MSERCPLGYECENPKQCVQFGLGIGPEAVKGAEEQGLVVSDIDSMGGFVEVCSGPLVQGFNEKAKAILRFRSLTEDAFGEEVARARAIGANWQYLMVRNAINQAVGQRDEA